MAYFKLISFSGIAPQISPRLLGETLAQTAEDVILDSGRLGPLRNNTDAYTLSATGRNSIFKYETGGQDYWLEWADEGVDVVLGPIAADPTDGLWDDGRTDEDQLGVTYAHLEEAMECGTGSGVETLEHFNTLNQHKMQPIPTFKL